MTQQERNGLNEAAEISVHAAGAVRGAIKTGKAVSGAAKGAAAAGPYGAAAAALWTHRKAVVAIIAGLLAIPVLFIMLLPSLIFGGLTQTGSEGNPDSPILNDNTAIVENINQISQAISDLLEEGLEDVRTRIDADFGASSADQKEIVNPYESSPAYNANRFIAMYCAAKDQDYASISLKDMEALIRKAKDALYTFTSTEESRTTTVTETNTDPKTGKVTVTETEVTEIWKIYIAVCGTGGAGKTFLILLMALRMRRMVIMAPEMVRVISPDPSVCKTCKVYLLTMQFTLSETDIRELLYDSIRAVEPAAAASGITIVPDFPEEPVIVSCDDTQLRRAVTNILSNGVRYARSELCLTCRADKRHVTIRIQDDGDGIAEADLPHIFDRFYMGKSGKSGIGLALTKEIVHLHKGMIRAYNGDGGAVFEITLPMGR